jgi:hypothetical protein
VQFKEEPVRSVPRGGTGGAWSVNLAGQNASIAATDLVPATSVDGGLYVVKGIVRVTTAAGTSSSLQVGIGYTDDDVGLAVSSVTQGFQAGALTPALVNTPANSTGATGIYYFTETFNARAGIAITYATAYASNAAGAMVYNLHLMCSRF